MTRCLPASGVMRVDSIAGLLETAKLVSVAGVPKGDRLAVFTCSGADNLMTADLAQRHGFKLPELSAAQIADLRDPAAELRLGLQSAGLQHLALGRSRRAGQNASPPSCRAISMPAC